MLIDYNIIVLAFIIDVSKSIFQKIKPHLLEAACKLEADDHGYLYMPNNNCVEKGPFTSQISNYHQCPLRMDHAIKQTIQIMSQEDPDAKKYVFVMMDQYKKETNEYKIKKYLQNNNNCNWIFCDFNFAHQLKPLCDSLPNCQYFYLENDTDLTQTIISIYYPEEERSHLDIEFKIKYGKTPKEAEEELKEKYGKNISSTTTSEVGS